MTIQGAATCVATGTVIYKEGAGNCGNVWNGDFWRDLPVHKINKYHERSSGHQPVVEARLAYDNAGIAACFNVRDRYVVCRNTAFMASVCQDSCVEFFFQPGGAEGYFNFEVNCGGALHVSYIRDPERVAGGFKDKKPLLSEHGAQVRIFTSLPQIIDPEIERPLQWCLAFYIPRAILEPYCGQAAYGREGWRGNLYKCADKSSHPHWGAWQAVEPLNFHQPKFFAPLLFC